MKDYMRRDIAAENITRYNRGEISREQYLTQEKALLLTDKAEQQRIHDEAQGRLDSINARIAAIAAELEKKD